MSHLVYTVMLLGVVQGAALAYVLARRQQNRLANRILAALVAALALMLFLGYLDRRWGFSGHPHFIALGSPLPYLFSPLLYLYVVSLTAPLEKLHPRSLIHALPFFGNCIFMTEAFFVKSGAEKLDIARRFLAGDVPASVAVMQMIMVVQAVAYMAACIVVLLRYGKSIRGFFSDIHRIDLRWLTTLVFGNAGVWSIVAAAFFLQLAGVDSAIIEALRGAVQISSVLIIFLIGYISLWQPDLFERARLAQGVATEHKPEPESSGPARPTSATTNPPITVQPRSHGADKYQRNRLADDEAREIAAKLRALIETQQPYRDAALTLQTLADALAVTPHTLSQVLNVHMGQSFYAFTNRLRVEALSAALADPELNDEGVLQLAFAAGFNSKSTVNSVFKKHTGLTPTQFRARAQATFQTVSPEAAQRFQ